MSDYVVKGGRALRFGYTTGSCATAAATAAATMLFSTEPFEQMLITLPQGEQVTFSLESANLEGGKARCAVVKDAGDDPDVTDGITIVATCEKIDSGIIIQGGEGVGTVTMDGLPVAKGQPAINPAPRRMIESNVLNVCRRYGYDGGLLITLSAPGGEEIARKTFNPRLGIVGGISILGTTGIVEPMSEKAMIDTIKLLYDKQKLVDPQRIVITPGNYGRSFITDNLKIESSRVVAYSNFLGDSLDYLAYKDFKNILLVGHFGKLVKVAGGIMHTHSFMADCRMEIITAHAACAGADTSLAQHLMQCPTTDAALALLERNGLAQKVCESLLEKILFHLGERLQRSAHGLGPSKGEQQRSDSRHASSGMNNREDRSAKGIEDSGKYAGEYGWDKPNPPALVCPAVEVIVFSGNVPLMQSKGAQDLVCHFRKEKP